MGLSIGGMAKWAGGIAGALKGLGALQRVTGWLSWIPGVGVIPGVVSALVGFVVGAIRKFFEGLTVILSNPVTLVTVGFVTMVAAAFGMKLGVEWSDYRVAQAQSEVRQMQLDLEAAHAYARDRAGAADRARLEAEEAARQAADAAERAGDARRAAAARRVRRDEPAKPASGSGSGMSWAETIFSGH